MAARPRSAPAARPVELLHGARLGRVVERGPDAVDAWMAALVLVWGTAFVSIKVLGHVLDPFQLTWYRYVPFLLGFGGWLLLRRRDRFREVRGGDWVRIAVAGAFAVLGYHFPLNWALSDLTPGPSVTGATGAILVATTPLWTLLMAVAVGQERFGGAKAVGSVIAFAGVGVVVFLGSGRAEFSTANKTLVALLAPILWGAYSILAKPLVARYGPLFVSGLTMSLGTLMLLPLGLRYGVEPLMALDAAGWWWMLYLSVAATLGGYTIWNLSLKHRSASEITAYIYGVPVVATLAGALLLSEPVTPYFVLGAALVLGGLLLINRARAAPATAPGPGAAAAKP